MLHVVIIVILFILLLFFAECVESSGRLDDSYFIIEDIFGCCTSSCTLSLYRLFRVSFFVSFMVTELTEEQLKGWLMDHSGALLINEEIATILRRELAKGNNRYLEMVLCALQGEASATNLHTGSLIQIDETVMSILVDCITVESISASDYAAAAVEAICAIDLKKVPLVVDAFKRSSDSQVACRFAAVVAKLMQRGDAAFLVCRDTGALAELIKLCLGTDILTQIVVMEYLTVLGASSAGLGHFFGEKVHLLLLPMITAAETQDTAVRCIALHVLSELLRAGYSTRPDLVPTSLLVDYLAAVTTALQVRDEALIIAAMDAVVELADVSTAILQAVLDNAALIEAWLPRLNGKVELQSVALKSIAQILAHTFDGDLHSSDDLKQQLFKAAEGAKRGLLDFAVQASQRPFPDTKCAAYSLLAALSTVSWGPRLLLSMPGFLEFIVDLGLEPSRDGKLWKFAVVKALSDNKTSLVTAPADVLAALEGACLRGPFHVTAHLAGPIAIDR